MSGVPSGTEPEPGAFARALSEEIRLAMTRRRMSGTQVAAKAGRSASYISKRLREEASLTATDVEVICAALGEDLLGLVVRAVRKSHQH